MGAAKKLDLKKADRHLYRPPLDRPMLVDVPEMRFLAIDGQGDPNTSQEYMDAIGALYSVAYGVKFALKRGPATLDFAVMPLESLWWTDEGIPFEASNKTSWKWTALIRQPDQVTDDLVRQAVEQAEKKRASPGLSKIRQESFREGLSAQVMHVGPYAEEERTVEKLHAFIAERGFGLGGKHHEIYLTDPHRTKPDRMRTVVRQPVRDG